MSFDLNQARRTIASPDSCATALVVAALGLWGPQFLSWSPWSIRMEADDTTETPMTALQYDRLLAGAAVLHTNQFFQLVPDFVSIAHALNGDGYDPSLWSPPDLADAVWALFEAGVIESLVLGPRAASAPSEDVREFIGNLAVRDGVYGEPPSALALIRGAGASTGAAEAADRVARLDPADRDEAAAGASERRADVEREMQARWSRLLAQVGDVLRMTSEAVAGLVAAAE